MDLLTQDEEQEDEITAKIRFDIRKPFFLFFIKSI
jgi:hypothetical protein